MPAPGPLFAVLAELTAVVGLIGAVFGLLVKYQEWRNKRKEFEHLDARGRTLPAAPATGLAGLPAWVFPMALVGGMVLLCGGCAVTMFKSTPVVNPGNGPGPEPGPGPGPGPGPTPPPPKSAGRKVPVNRAVDSWNDKIAVTLESVEFRPDGKMRWYFTFWNQTGVDATAWMEPFGGASYLVDQNGNKSKGLAHSEGTTLRFGLPNGEKKPYWIDFQAPAPDATRLVAHFAADGLDARVQLPTIGLELVPGADGPGVSADPLTRTVRLGKALATWDPQIACTLEAVEFRPDGRMRWRYSYWNRSGHPSDVYTYPDPATTYLTDEKGTKYPGVAHAAAGTLSIGLPDGEKVASWIEFKSPPPDAAWLTARFGSGLHPERKVPDVVLHLPPGKAGPMVSLTFVADAGAAVLDETLDLTVGGGAAKLHVTKDKPRAETTAIVPAGTEVKYAVKAATRVSLNGVEATYAGAGAGAYTPPADRRLVYVRDTSRGFTNFGITFQEPR